jgi:hypothetical protein
MQADRGLRVATQFEFQGMASKSGADAADQCIAAQFEFQEVAS